MGLMDSLRISASALMAQRLRMDVIANNVANMNTSRTAEGGPYRRQTVVFAEKGREVAFRDFLAQQSARYGRAIEGFSPAAMDALFAHSWPGNVRELEHSVERSVLMARGSRIEAADLGLRQRGDGSVAIDELTLDEAERIIIEKALERNQGNVSKTAEALGLSRSALYRRLQRHDNEADSE